MAGRLISQREYARLRGITHSAVQKAITARRISTVDGKIDPEVADREWKENTDQSKPSNIVTGRPKHRRHPNQPAAPMPLGDAFPGGTTGPPSKGYAQARAVRESYDARLRKLEFEQRNGKLIDADEVRVVAFNRARRTRDLLLAVPDRLAPILVAVTDPIECHRVLTEEITRVCEELSRVASQ